MTKKIINIVLFISFIGIILFISLSSWNTTKYSSKEITFTGNNYLSVKQYIKFAHLDTLTIDRKSLSNIRDRLQKHPYVRTANVMIVNDHKLQIEISEKHLLSLIFRKNKKYFITKEQELLPVLPRTKNLDLPIISNIDIPKKATYFDIIRDSDDINNALKIITAVQTLNTEMYNSLSEINLRNGRDILLTFEHIDAPVIIGKQFFARKITYLNELWSLIVDKDYKHVLEYVDLRFDKHIYLGLFDEGNSDRRTKS